MRNNVVSKGFISYYLLIMFLCISLIFQNMLTKSMKTEELVRSEMDYITCLYGVERGIVWLLAYFSNSVNTSDTDLLIFQNDRVTIGAREFIFKENQIQCVVFCEHQISHLVVRKKLRLRYEKHDGDIKINVIDIIQI